MSNDDIYHSAVQYAEASVRESRRHICQPQQQVLGYNSEIEHCPGCGETTCFKGRAVVGYVPGRRVGEEVIQ